MLEGNLQGFQHLGVPVTDLERSQAFYMQFGFEIVMATSFPTGSGTVHVAMLKKNDFTFELYQLPEEERRQVAGRDDGHIDHIALSVLDIDQACADVRAAGLDILEENAPLFLPFWGNGVRYFTVRGPDGEKVEFNQIL
jgi:catechol 2,3-dioxygenase-like lactoylglutathione lyase family enzyme